MQSKIADSLSASCLIQPPACAAAAVYLRYFNRFVKRQRRCLVSSIVLVMLAVPIWAQVVHLPTEDLDPLPLSGQSGRYLLGDWNGARTALAERGISFDLFYIAELQANPTGGLKQAQAGWERIRGTVDVNCESHHAMARSSLSCYRSLAGRSQFRRPDRHHC